MFGKNRPKCSENNRDIFHILWKTPQTKKLKKSPKKLLHFFKKYNELGSVEQ